MKERIQQCYLVEALLRTLDKVVAEVPMRPELGAQLLQDMNQFESAITICWSGEEVESVANRVGVPLTKLDVRAILNRMRHNHYGDEGISFGTISDTITNTLPNGKAEFAIDVSRFFKEGATLATAEQLATLLNYSNIDDFRHTLMTANFLGETYTLVLTNQGGFAFKWYNASEDFIMRTSVIDFANPLATVKDLIKETDLRF